jgi:hypothetical protein
MPKETTSMLHQPYARIRPTVIDPDQRRRPDRAMAVLQYGTAFLAIVVAVLLASVR